MVYLFPGARLAYGKLGVSKRNRALVNEELLKDVSILKSESKLEFPLKEHSVDICI